MTVRAWGCVAMLAGATVGGLVGCAMTPPRIGEPGPTLKDPDAEGRYKKVLDRYSAVEEIYSLFDTRLFVGATYQGWEFREARVLRVAAFKAQPVPVVEKLLAQERAEADQYHDFFMAVHVNDWRFEDFSQKDSIWRLALVTPHGESTPVDIHRLGRADLDTRSLYPYADDFWVAYQVRFPKEAMAQAPGDRFLLRVASSLGKADLQFRP